MEKYKLGQVFDWKFKPWYLYKMVAQKTERTTGVNQLFRFGYIERVVKFETFFSAKTYFTSYMRNMF